MTWLQPLWLAYPTAALALLTLIFGLWVRWWLHAFPVTPLNWAYERKYEKPRPYVTSANLHQVYAASASSAVAHVHIGVPYKRTAEHIIWTGHLPEVGS
jgi:hypothetical protein